MRKPQINLLVLAFGAAFLRTPVRAEAQEAPDGQWIVVPADAGNSQMGRIYSGSNGEFIWVPVNQPEVDLPMVGGGFASDRDVQGPITPLVRSLTAADYTERRAASETLLRLPPERLGDVVSALMKEKDEEAVARLNEVAGHLYLKPRTHLKARSSLLGVWFNHQDPSLIGILFELGRVKIKSSDPTPTMTALVREIQIGFPALQTLRAGDRIVAINGEGFSGDFNDADFHSRIAVLWPGTVVPMLVLRDGKLLELGVQLTGLPADARNDPANLLQTRSLAIASFLQSLHTAEPAGPGK